MTIREMAVEAHHNSVGRGFWEVAEIASPSFLTPAYEVAHYTAKHERREDEAARIKRKLLGAGLWHCAPCRERHGKRVRVHRLADSTPMCRNCFRS